MIPYFPFYPSDWLSSPRITTSDYHDRGLYIHLLCQAWGHPGCQLPDDRLYLMRLCPGARWSRIARVLETFFTKTQLNTEFWWRNDRLTVEFHKALEKHSKAKVSAKVRWNKEKPDANAMRTDMRTQCERNANQNQNQKNLTPSPPKRPVAYPEWFEAWWSLYPAREGKKAGKRASFDLSKPMCEVDRELLVTATKNYAAATESKYVKDPERFLKKDYWRDFIEVAPAGGAPETPSYRKG